MDFNLLKKLILSVVSITPMTTETTNLPHRIAAGGLVFYEDRVLLVRYSNNNGSGILVAPGGALNPNENIEDAIIREVFEETAVTVQPLTIVMVEDLVCSKYKMSKTWMVCRYLSGHPDLTEEARIEGINRVDWYAREQLESEIVFPTILKEMDWGKIMGLKNDVHIPKSRRMLF